MAEVHQPFAHEVARYLFTTELKAEDIGHLCGEDGDGDTARKAHDDGIGDEFDDCSQLEHTQQHQDDACHQRGHDEARFTILLDDAVDDDDERTCRSANLHLAAAQQGDDETRDDGGHDTFLGRYTRRDTKSNSQRKGHNTHNDTGHEVGHKHFFGIILQCRVEFRLEFERFHFLISRTLFYLLRLLSF